MPDFHHKGGMRSYRSGALGEHFCKETFGIGEPRYEIKSAGARNGLVIVQICQLLDQMEKQYVIVRYRRKSRTLKKGARKGASVFTETVEEGYANNPVQVAVVRGWKLVEIAIREKLAPYCAAPGGSVYLAGKWGVYWRVPIKFLPFDDAYLVEETEKYRLFAFPDDPPAWHGEEIAKNVQGGLFAGGNGKKKDVIEPVEEDEDQEDIPF